MDPATWIALILKVGVPLAEQLLAMAHAGEKVTPESWSALKAQNAIAWEALTPMRHA